MDTSFHAIDAIYEGGVFRPLTPSEFKDGERVRLLVGQCDSSEDCPRVPDFPLQQEEFEAPMDLPHGPGKQVHVHCGGIRLPEGVGLQFRMYYRLTNEASLEQGEIIDDCPILYWEAGAGAWEAVESLARVVVLSQACDLANEKTTRVQVALVHSAKQLVKRGILNPSTIRDQLVRHRIFGWYFLPAGGHMPESIVDLRDIHTVPRALLEELVHKGKHVCTLVTPYREHLAQHFAVTFSRIGLPEPYRTDPQNANRYPNLEEFLNGSQSPDHKIVADRYVEKRITTPTAIAVIRNAVAEAYRKTIPRSETSGRWAMIRQ